MAAVGSDPLPQVLKSGLQVGVEQLVTLPATGSPALARIQQIVDAPDAAARFYVLDDRGVIKVVEDGQVLSQPFLDLRGADIGFYRPGDETGLRSIAFHPDFANPGTAGYGKVYTVQSMTVHSAQDGVPIFDVGGTSSPVYFHDVLIEWTVSDPSQPFSVDTASRREVLRIRESYANHNMNQLAFNPNAEPGDADYGLVYIGIGDGGGAYDPNNHAQQLDQIQGKIIRIDPLQQADGATYGIPDDNPYVGVSSALPEIWASGFRNPQTLSFDTGGSGTLFVGEIGQALIEEINVVVRGGNYGWDVREGTFALIGNVAQTLPAGDASFGYQYPLTQYDHQEIQASNPFGFVNAAIAGGFVYRGSAIPELYGQYLFADFPTGRVFHVPVDYRLSAALLDGVIEPGEQITPQELTLYSNGIEVTAQEFGGSTSGRVDLRFGTDAAGELYVFSKQTGEIWKLDISGERQTGTNGFDWLTGTSRSDVIEGGESTDYLDGGDGNDSLDGGGGYDSLSGGAGNDTLSGGAGIDTLVGGSGNDTYLVQHRQDVVIETAGGGVDEVVSTVSWTLDANVEHLTLVNTDRRVGTGNALDNRLTGGSGENELYGLGGNDTLEGVGAARDTLTGGSGNDRFVFSGAIGEDRITDWQDGQDLIVLRGYGAALDSFADLNIVVSGSSTLILLSADVPGAGTITLAGYTGGLGAEDFLFS